MSRGGKSSAAAVVGVLQTDHPFDRGGLWDGGRVDLLG